MYTESDINFMRQQAVELRLKYPAEFMTTPASRLVQIANGYGPDRWPEKMRRMLSWIFRYYPAPAAIHDLRYELSDGSEVTRRAADAEFAANLMIVWKNKYGRFRLLNPVAWYGYWKLRPAILLTVKFGRRAWLEAWRSKRSKGDGKNE